MSRMMSYHVVAYTTHGKVTISTHKTESEAQNSMKDAAHSISLRRPHNGNNGSIFPDTTSGLEIVTMTRLECYIAPGATQ